MTGVQTCALPICFPVTIPADAIVEELRKLKLRTDEISRRIGWYDDISEFKDIYPVEVRESAIHGKGFNSYMILYLKMTIQRKNYIKIILQYIIK